MNDAAPSSEQAVADVFQTQIEPVMFPVAGDPSTNAVESWLGWQIGAFAGGVLVVAGVAVEAAVEDVLRVVDALPVVAVAQPASASDSIKANISAIGFA